MRKPTIPDHWYCCEQGKLGDIPELGKTTVIWRLNCPVHYPDKGLAVCMLRPGEFKDRLIKAMTKL